MRILAVASVGGHWIELLRLMPVFEGKEVIFASTKSEFSQTVEGYQFYPIPEINRNKKIQIFNSIYKTFSLIRRVKPQIIISTGAMPGLMALFIGKLYGSKTIWVDSIANVDELSYSGKMAAKFADRTYTQWQDLASKNCLFHGNIIS